MSVYFDGGDEDTLEVEGRNSSALARAEGGRKKCWPLGDEPALALVREWSGMGTDVQNRQGLAILRPTYATGRGSERRSS